MKPMSLRRRFIYNCDANNTFIYDDFPMQPADVYSYVDELAGTGITTFFMSPNVGMNMNYPSQITDMVGTHLSPELAELIKDPAATRRGSNERGVVNMKSLVDAGYDPLGLLLERAREKGMEVFISFRLNEVHAVDEADNMILSRFWKEHPEWRIGRPGDKLSATYLEIIGPNVHPIVAGWLPGGLNFAVPEVRTRRLAQLRECCERYPIDGLDLDFQRFPMYFPPGTEADNVATMTAWMRQVHDMVCEIGRKRNRDLLLSARIMARPEQNLAIGLDPATWAREGLVDFITISHYLRNDFPLPVADYKPLFPQDMPLYASIEVARDADTYRRIARRLWDEGADGIMLFNFFTTRESGREPPFELLNELGDPARIRPTAGEQEKRP